MKQEYCKSKYIEIGIKSGLGRLVFGENRPADTDFIRLCYEECNFSRKISTLKGTGLNYCGARRR